MAAVRRIPRGTLGGYGKGPEPPGLGSTIVRERVHLRPANDNAPIHGGREALWLAAEIALTLGASIVVLTLVA